MIEENRDSDDIEEITIQRGWAGIDRVYYCRVSRNGLCVEDYALTKRKAIHLARKAWEKENREVFRKTMGYPRRVECPPVELVNQEG